MANKTDEYKEKRNEAERALKVDGYSNFIFYDDIFLMDRWHYEDALNYLVGIKEVFEVSDGSTISKHFTTLGGDFYLEHEAPHITTRFELAKIRLLDFWQSGLHDIFNSPKYYIDWAISKRFQIPWLAYALEKEFYTPKVEILKQSQDLKPRERETMIKIINALATNGYKYPSHGSLKEIVEDFERNNNGVSEKTLKKYLDEFDTL
jgi:hypothetical protein